LHWPFNPRPRSDIRQVFQRNRPLCAFGFGNQPLADDVVRILLESALTPLQLTQSSFGRFRHDLLERVPTLGISLAAAFNLFSAERLTRTISCQIDDAEINTKRSINVCWIWLIYVAGGEQMELSVDQAQIGLTVSRFKQSALTIAAHKRDRLSPIEGPDRDVCTCEIPREDAIIVGDGCGWPKGALALLIQLVGVCDFGDAANRQLRAKLKRLTYRVIAQLLQPKLAEGARLPRDDADVGTCFIRSIEGALEGVRLCQRWQQLHLCDDLHTKKCTTFERSCQSKVAARRVLLAVNGVGFRALEMSETRQTRLA
jgi:hypothetical protein